MKRKTIYVNNNISFLSEKEAKKYDNESNIKKIDLYVYKSLKEYVANGCLSVFFEKILVEENNDVKRYESQNKEEYLGLEESEDCFYLLSGINNYDIKVNIGFFETIEAASTTAINMQCLKTPIISKITCYHTVMQYKLHKLCEENLINELIK